MLHLYQMAMINRKIGLEGVRFFAPIGYFKEERIFKNEFIVAVQVEFDVKEIQNTESLDETVDYSQLYEICAFHFNKEAQLIETVAHAILEEITVNYPFLKTIKVRINKNSPPFKAEIHNSFIELNYQK